MVLGVAGRSVSGLAGAEVLADSGVDELLAHQVAEEQDRAARPVVEDDVLGLTGGVEGYQDDDADGLAVHLGGVVLEEAVVAAGAGVVEFLVLIQGAGLDHDCADLLRALECAVPHRAFPGDVVG